MLFNALAALGHRGIKTTATFGRAGLMLFNAVVGKPEFRKHAPLLVRQLYNVGVLSMLIIIVSGLFIGMVLGLQGYLVLTTYSAETSLGMLVALSLLRELGPVVAALLGILFAAALLGHAKQGRRVEVCCLFAMLAYAYMEVQPFHLTTNPTALLLCGAVFAQTSARWQKIE